MPIFIVFHLKILFAERDLINLLNLYYIKFKTENKSNMIKNTRYFQEKQKSKFLKFDI